MLLAPAIFWAQPVGAAAESVNPASPTYAASSSSTQVIPGQGRNSMTTEVTVENVDLALNVSVSLAGGGAYVEKSLSSVGYAAKIHVNGNHGYIPVNENSGSGLRIMDLATPGNPVPLGYCQFSTPADQSNTSEDVFVVGTLAYVAGSFGVKVVEVRDKTNPTLIAELAISGYSRAITGKGNYLYAANASTGMEVLDITDPYNPARLKTIPMDQPYDFTVVAQLLYATTAKELLIFQLFSAGDPVLVGRCTLPGTPRGLFVKGHHAFIAAGNSGLLIANVGNPAKPVVIGATAFTGIGHNGTGFAENVVVDDNYAYVVDNYYGMRVVSIADPAHPVFKGALSASGAHDLVQFGKIVLLTSHSYYGLSVINVANPFPPALFTPLQTNSPKIALRGDIAVFLNQNGRLDIFNITNPKQPVLLGQYEQGGTAMAVAYRENGLVYALIDRFGSHYLQIFNLTDPTHPLLVSEILIQGGIFYIDEPYIYTAFGSTFFIYTLDGSRTPALSGSYTIPPTAYDAPQSTDLPFSGKHAYLLCNFGMMVLDISDRANPRPLATVPIPSYPTDLAFKGNHALVTTLHGGLYVYDILNPGNPVSVTNLSGGTMRTIAIAGERAFIGGGVADPITVIDISNPAAPFFLAKLPYDGSSLTASENLLIVNSGNAVILPMPEIMKNIDVVSGRIRFTVPANLLPGPYNIMLCDRNGATTVFPNGFQVLDGNSFLDSDGDGVPDGQDACPSDPVKSAGVGQCGCNNPEIDSDGNGTADCIDAPRIREEPPNLNF